MLPGQNEFSLKCCGGKELTLGTKYGKNQGLPQILCPLKNCQEEMKSENMSEKRYLFVM